MPYMICSGPRRPDVPLARAVGQPRHERGRLLGEAEPQQAVERERGVADPRVAVVVVALAADLLGQRRGRRGDDRARRRVGEQLQRQRRALHHLAPAAAVARTARASGASTRRWRRTPRRSRAPGTRGRCGPGATLSSTNDCDLPAASSNTTRTPLPTRCSLRSLPPSIFATAPSSASVRISRAEQHAVRVHLDLVLRAPVVEPRLHLDEPADLAAHHEHAPDQAVAVRAGARDRHEVLHLPHAAGREEARDQDVRVREVELLRGPVVAVGAQRVEAAVVRVEDRAEHARGVERRAAVPVDRARRCRSARPCAGRRRARARRSAGTRAADRRRRPSTSRTRARWPRSWRAAAGAVPRR